MHGALQGLIVIEQPQPCSCSCAGGSLSTLSAGPTRLPQQPWCCRGRVIPPPEPHFSRTQVGSLCFDGSPGPQHPPNPALPDSPAFPASVFPTAGASGMVTQASQPQDHPAGSPHSNHPASPSPHITDSTHTLAEGSFGDSYEGDLQVLADVPAVLVVSGPGPSQQRSAAPGSAAAWPRWLVSQHFLVRGCL